MSSNCCIMAVYTGSLVWSKLHDFEGILLPIGSKKLKFAAVGRVDRNLIVDRPSVKANEVQPAMAFAEVVNVIATSRDGVLE